MRIVVIAKKRSHTRTVSRRTAFVLVWAVAVPLAHGVAPWAISLLSPRSGWETSSPGIWNLFGCVPIALGIAGLVWIMVAASVESPERIELRSAAFLVTSGPYAYSRNPMYVSELVLWLGWAVLYGNVGVLIGFAILFAVLVPATRYEERVLEGRFGDAYRAYKGRVSRWLGPAWTSEKRPTVCPIGLIQTSYGPLEYAVLGEGLPLVVMHGSGGGVRHGLVMRYLLDTRRIQIIALSRPGYWGTPLETAPEIEQQADRVVELLDALKIETAAVLGHSAGGPPAAHFALRHPERCLGLVLLSALLPPPNARVALMIRSMPVMFRVLDFSDWPLRVFIAFVLRVLLPLMGVLNIRRLAQDEARRMVREMFEGMIPASAWRAGTLNDHLRLGTTPLAFEACRVPTLIVHGTAETAAAYEQARAAADAVPGAQVLFIEGGSHGIFATHCQEVGAAIEAFLLRLKN